MSQPPQNELDTRADAPPVLAYASGLRLGWSPNLAGIASVGWAAVASLGLAAGAMRFRRVGMAILVVGCLAAIVSALMGIAASRRSPAKRKLAAIAGLLLGIFGLASAGHIAYHAPARERANRMHCADQLRLIGIAIQLYSGCEAAMPPDMGALYAAFEFTRCLCVCPSADTQPAAGNTVDEIAAQLRDPRHCSYVYYGDATWLSSWQENSIIVSDRLENHDGFGMHVLLADGRILWLDGSIAKKVAADLAAGLNPPPSLPRRPSDAHLPDTRRSAP